LSRREKVPHSLLYDIDPVPPPQYMCLAANFEGSKILEPYNNSYKLPIFRKTLNVH
jgi:hypothetical protein